MRAGDGKQGIKLQWPYVSILLIADYSRGLDSLIIVLQKCELRLATKYVVTLNF